MKPTDLNRKHEQIMKFAEWTMDKIGIEKRPGIELTDDIEIVKQNRAYGATTPDGKIWTYVGNRTPADAMRTLCHEILHAKQFEDGVAHEQMNKKTEQHIEDLANAHAGRMMRQYGKQHEEIYEQINQDIIDPKFVHSKRIGNYEYRATAHSSAWNKDERGLKITCWHARRPIAFADFVIHSNQAGDQWLESDNTIVNSRYRGQGISREMYAYARSLGNTIKPSRKIEPGGERMWQRWHDSGDAKNFMSEGKEGSLIHDVADSLPYAYAIPDLNASNNPYLQYKFSVAIAGARGRKSRDSDGLQPFHDTSEAEYFNDEEVVISFDPHIGEIIDQAMADIGMKGGKRIIGVKGSKEAKDVKKSSPVVGFKGYPR